jgi:DNA repair protein RecN (Recombination protein N)
MLEKFSIRNFALIRELDLDLPTGFTTVTGETGAGKSMLLGAIQALLGGRIPRDTLPAGEETKLRGEFCIDPNSDLPVFLKDLEYDCTSSLEISREISIAGRSKYRINGKIATVKIIKELESQLVDYHGQRDLLGLIERERHQDLFDLLPEISGFRLQHRRAWQKWKSVSEQTIALRRKCEERQRHIELWQYQLKELESLQALPNEDDSLSAELKVLANAEELKKSGFQLSEMLLENEDCVHERLSQMLQSVESMSKLDSVMEDVQRMLQDAVLQVQEAAAALSARAHEIEHNPERLTEVQDRLSILDGMIRKYGGSLKDLFLQQKQIEKELNASSTLDTELAAAEKELQSAHSQLMKAADNLSAVRVKGAKRLDKAIAPILEELGIRGGQLIANLEKTGSTTNPSGHELPVFLVSTNPDTKPGPLEQIASGGELSRIMLALKLVLLEEETPRCIIFDEIDSGLSGRAALAVADVLKRLAKAHQLICITHLPQIAAAAAEQIEVEKSWSGKSTSIRIHKLERENRLRVIARLQAGIESREELESAERLLSRSGH